MCVLDWLIRVLRCKDWYDFAPANASIEGIDRWYWIYCYAAMRSLGMTEPADQLQTFCQHLVDDHDAVKYFNDYLRLLRVIKASDPLVGWMARKTAQQLVAGDTALSEIECSQLASLHPLFGEAVNICLAQQAGTYGTDHTDGDDAMEQ